MTAAGARRVPSELVTGLAVAAVVAVSLLWLPLAADPYQPVRALVVAAAAGVVFAYSWDGRAPGRMGAAAAALVGLLVVLEIVSAFANQPASSVWGVHGRFVGLFSLLVLVLVGLAGYVGVGSYGRWVSRAAAAVVAVQSAVVLVQRLAGSEPVGTMGNTVLTGGWLAVGTAVALAGALAERGRTRVALFVAAGLGAAALGVVGSRGAWVGLALGLVALAAATASRKRPPWWVWALVAGLLVVGIVAGGPAVRGRLDPADLQQGSAASRLEIWRVTADMIGDRPFLGVGPGRYLYEFPAYDTPERALAEGVDVRPDQAHGVWLHTAAEAGLPAAVCLLGLAGLALAAGWVASRRGDATGLIALAGLAAWAGQALFGISTIEIDAFAWMLGGVALARADLARARESDEAAAYGATGEARAERPPAASAVIRVAAAALAFGLAAAAAYYLVADARYRSGLDALAAADFSGALSSHERAVATNPAVDVYRVGASDAARFLQSTGSQSAPGALALLEDGLELEPASYDLRLARARTLAVAGAPPAEVLEAYMDAVEAYPLGLTVRREAMEAALVAGDAGTAQGLARDVLELYPSDPVALATLEVLSGE
jgi:O-antigen ligase